MPDYFESPDGHGEPTIWVRNPGRPDHPVAIIRSHDVHTHYWPDVVARMTGTTVVNDETTTASIGRVTEFLRQWQIARNKGDLIYGVHHDIDADMADLTVTDLTAILAALTGVPHD